MPFAQHYQNTLDELSRICASCGRDPRDVKVIAVSKTVGIDAVRAAVAAGAHDFGETALLLAEKAAALPGETWHFIGNIQSRKIPEIVANATLVHSLYKESHLAKFDAAAQAVGKVQDVLLEVNVSGEESKSGLAPADVADVLAHAVEFSHIRVRGLMTMAPQGDLAVVRECFNGLAALRDQLRTQLSAEQAAAFNELSMGMSEDWREAVCAGATMVRIGRALFSDTFEAPDA